MHRPSSSLSNGTTTPISCFHFPLVKEDYDPSDSIAPVISNPLSPQGFRLQGQVHKASINGHLSIASLLSNAFLQPDFPTTSNAIIQSGQLGLTFAQIDLISRRVAVIISSLVIQPGSDYQVSTNNDGDSVILLIIDHDNHVDEHLIILIFAILRLGATYMVVNRQDLTCDVKSWKELLALIEPIMVITQTDPHELEFSIREELTVISRENFEDDLEGDYHKEYKNSKNKDKISKDKNNNNTNNNASSRCSSATTADSLSVTEEMNTFATVALMKRIRGSLILKSPSLQPVAISCKCIWDLSLELKMPQEVELPVIHFKSDIPLGQRTALIFRCHDPSSGKTRWCRLGHRALRNRISWERLEFPMNSNEKCCLSFPLTDPRSLVQIFCSFIHAKPLLIEEDETDINLLLRKLGKERQVSRVELTPKKLQLLLDAAVECGLEGSLYGIKTWLVSGTYFPPSLAKYFFKVVTSNDALLVPMYGKAEVLWCVAYNMFANVLEVNKWTLEKGTRLSMGVPISNTSIYILDERTFNFCPFGQKGEICVSGSMVPTNGYSGAPIFGRSNIFFQTGNLGRVILDRRGNKQLLVETTVDSRVNLNRKLIDLDEISRKIKQDRSVIDAFAFVCRRGRDLPAVVVAVTMSTNGNFDKLQQKIFQLEPMVSCCFHLNNIPLFPDGQVDLKQLRASYFKFLGNARDWDKIFEPPRHSNQIYKKPSDTFAKNIQIMCKAVAFSLGVSVAEVIDRIEESFWDIGGTPLRSILTVKSCLCQGKRLSVEDFVITNKVADLTRRLTLAEKDDGKWNQGVYLTKRNFIYSKMTRKDRKDLQEILFSNLSQSVDTNHRKEIDKYVSGLLDIFDNALSAVGLTAETREVVGVAFNYKGCIKSHFLLPQIEEGIELFNMVLQSSKHLMKGIENKNIAKSYLISLKSSGLSPAQSVLVTRDLIKESMKNAESIGCKAYLLCTVDPLIQEICTSLLGFEVLSEMQLNLYKNKRLQKPFIHLDDHQLVGAYWKKISATAASEELI
ncbi:Bacitracin synthase 3 [Orchesella cincta]|uniref:Bacitracin synthase 3 n=1 Tax=Orchesella cincta TaxID=48709 RepID=A0A1D2MLU6_ORCCI|nr:Bacitracin synthase 3 [Orchesella cincta]